MSTRSSIIRLTCLYILSREARESGLYRGRLRLLKVDVHNVEHPTKSENFCYLVEGEDEKC